jgi:hypothetical protein
LRFSVTTTILCLTSDFPQEIGKSEADIDVIKALFQVGDHHGPSHHPVKRTGAGMDERGSGKAQGASRSD